MTRKRLHRFCANASIAMSILDSIWVLGNAAAGARSGGDEGIGFHIFWLLIALQLPFLIGFVMTADWTLSRSLSTKAALIVAGLTMAFASVAYFHL